MKYKKILVDILVITIGLILFVIWYDNSNLKVAQTTASTNQTLKIYLITKDKQIQFWRFMDSGANDMAKMLGVTYIWDAPPIPNTDEQIVLLNKAVESGANAILIAADDVTKLSEPIKNAKEKGVKIIYVDTPAQEEAITTLATNNYSAGKEAGENMIAELEYLGINQGNIGIFGINQTTSTTMQREQGFRDTLTKHGGYNLLDTDYSNNNELAAEEAATKKIKENKDLVGLFATNESSSEGVGNAIKADGNRIIGIGFDISDTTMQLLQSGSLKAIIAQNPYTMGYLGVAQAYAALKGLDTGPAYLNTGVSVIRKR